MKIALFDIDYTLYDTSHFHKNFYKKLEKIFGVKEEDIRKKSFELIEKIVEDNDYLSIDKYLTLLANSFKAKEKKKEIEEIIYNQFFFKSGFYKEVEETLNSVKKTAKIGIFSHGDEKFQRAKIFQSGFFHLFDKDIIYIKNNKVNFIPFLKKKHEKDKVFLIDDNPNVIVKVKEEIPDVFTIWIKRGEFAEKCKNIDKFKPDAVIDSLRESIKIIEGN